MSDKYSSTPRWLSDFSLSEEARKNIVEMVGLQRTPLVIFWCRQFLAELENESYKSTSAQVNEKIRRLHQCFFGYEKEVGAGGKSKQVNIPGVVALLNEIYEISENDAVSEEIDSLAIEIFNGFDANFKKEIRNSKKSLYPYQDSIESLKGSITPGIRKGHFSAQKSFVEKLCIVCCEVDGRPKRVTGYGGVGETKTHRLVKILAAEMNLPYETAQSKEGAKRIIGLKETVETCLKKAIAKKRDYTHWSFQCESLND